MNASDELQTLRRGLEALAFLNREGAANVACIARRLDVPRANAHRIVTTLTSAGYCRRVPNSHLYISSLQSQEIVTKPSSDGLITSVSIELIESLGQDVKWPVALSTPNGANMITRLATHLTAPLAIARIVPGRVSSMFDAATGIVHLAYTDEENRKRLLTELEADPRPSALAPFSLDAVLECVRQDGYFIIQRAGAEASMGVPVLLDGEPIAGIAMRYIKSASTRGQIVKAFLPSLQATATAIAEALRQVWPGPRPVVSDDVLTPSGWALRS